MVPDTEQHNALPENLNMDFQQKLTIDTEQLAWLPSPAFGVRRKPLEREQQESGHTTSIVKYAPDTSFSSHSHPLGEEIFVLEGVFSDEQGDYPAGSYIRNPPGSRHAPFSQDGCIIFVKLNQFDAEDLASVRVQTNISTSAGSAEDGQSECTLLHRFANTRTELVHYKGSAAEVQFSTEGGTELLVITGALEDGQGIYPSGCWLRLPHQYPNSFAAKAGARVLVKSGHLPY